MKKIASFTVDRVSGKEEHGRRIGGAVGDVQVGSDGETGAAVIDHIFNTEALSFQSAGDPGGKRGLFGGELK